MEDKKEECPDSAKSNKSLFFGTGGTLGIMSLLGACGGACSLAALPLGSFLGAIGLSSLAIYLPYLRWPLFALALVFSFFVLRTVIRQGNPLKIASVSLLLGASLVYSGYQAFRPSPCEMRTTLRGMLQQMTPNTQRVVREGIYGLWPKLGRAPTAAEIKNELRFDSETQVIAAFDEIRKQAPEVFYEASNNIKWMWPLSNLDHGITVVLEGQKPVHARCAIDALGISKMYGKPALISIKTPLFSKEIGFRVDGTNLKSDDTRVVVSTGGGCDETLFFSSKDEFEQYKKSAHKEYLKAHTLKEAFEDGLFSFGNILNS
jgi:hypothetical protein